MKTIGEQFREFINEQEQEEINEALSNKADIIQMMNALDDYYKLLSNNPKALELLDTIIGAMSDLTEYV